ncbi:MAG: hypothetical protein EG826_13360 [Deltaproteobacteria bacterium]|nr:hypothetical protein [Deltaproteobacteria bacterium]
MKKLFMYTILMALFFAPSTLLAADFDWMPDFNIQAQADPSGFRAKIGARFNIGDAQITAVLSNFPEPADAYVALRLGEMSGRSIDVVAAQYQKNKGRGWGALAKSLGIKPGSPEFHALKRGDDLYGQKGKGKGKKDKKR